MGYTQKQAEEFINMIAPLIRSEADKRGYNIVSTIIAQAIVEGAANTSILAKKYHNHFGMKCGSSWKGASVNLKTQEEYTKGTLTTIKDNFRAYSSDLEGIKGYFDFISAKRYANLKTSANYIQFAENLKADGYATSSTYVNTLCKTVEKYNLTRFDRNAVDIAFVNRPVLRKGSKGSDVVYLQTILDKEGYKLGAIDGIFGSKTEAALRQFQNEKLLVVDGICGKKSWAMLEQYA